MSTRGRHAFKFSSVHRALRAAERAGFRPDHFKVDADGTITVFVKPESESAGEGDHFVGPSRDRARAEKAKPQQERLR
jgi:hypothetical protein